MPPNFLASMSPARLRLILHIVGLVILIGGYSGAVLAWQAQDRIDKSNAWLQNNEAAPLSELDSRTGSRQLELYYGKSGAFMVSATNWAKSLAHGRGLAETLVVVSSVTAIGCFIVAGRQ